MTQRNFSTIDPREFDGTPFDVAGKSVEQIAGILRIAGELLPATILMVRNAEMERRLLRGDDPDAAGWDDTPEAKRWRAVEADLEAIRKLLDTLHRAAAFDPRAVD